MVATSSPRQPLHLLVVAASDEVAAPLYPVVADADKACEFHRIGTPAALRAALRDKPWDAVLYIPGVSSLSVQATVRQIDESGFDLPLIVVAGPNDERGTQRAMKAGAAT
jgi:hypothetical protein